MSIITTKLCFHINQQYKTLILKSSSQTLSQHSPSGVNLARSPLLILLCVISSSTKQFGLIQSSVITPTICFFFPPNLFVKLYRKNECNQLTDINMPLG